MILPDPLIARFVTFKKASSSISYDGSLVEGVVAPKIVTIVVTLVTSSGATSYDQLVTILAEASGIAESELEIEDTSVPSST